MLLLVIFMRRRSRNRDKDRGGRRSGGGVGGRGRMRVLIMRIVTPWEELRGALVAVVTRVRWEGSRVGGVSGRGVKGGLGMVRRRG
jgi:hypothetical protein